ncbi:biopolymer transporter ExbD [Marivita sp.]|uniref:ExbD/TolR family protein n=1 Tax=Marivita sp. TaxID=2003365 RepID=UPI0025C6C858|nr:biopolymer transporter ExbD [Marivita sp.]
MHDPATTVLKRPTPPRALISLVPMIDVMLILLVFFMVTSTYLNLDMIPAVDHVDDASDTPASGVETSARTMLIRVGADGVPTMQGQSLEARQLDALLVQRLQSAPDLRVMVLPTGAADMQALVAVMDIATRAGVTNLRVIRLEATE